VASVLDDHRLAGLVAPLEAWARPDDVVYLVPHDVLHVMPLHALPVEGRPLIDRNPVAVTPTTSVLRHSHRRRRPRSGAVLVVADPVTPRPLVYAREQADAVAASTGRAEVLAGAAATRSTVLSRLASRPTGRGGAAAVDRPDVVHFAAHGVFDAAEPMRSGVELSDGRLTAADVLGLSLDVDLVTLGACESGVSARRPGDELIGLTRALLYAGASAALLTLWRVDELSTSMLLRTFYAELAAGTSKAESLRRAQRRLRATTLSDAIGYAREARAHRHDDPATTAMLCRAEARLLCRAGDPAGSHDALDHAEGLPGLTAAIRDDLRVTRLQTRLAAPEPAAHPGLAAFDDPYHWAPFVLVGDWD